MLDKSIPYCNLIMKRRAGSPMPSTNLPAGYSFAPYREDFEVDWAEIETSVGEFDNTSEALEYFQKGYLLYPNEAQRRTVFIQTGDGKKVATATAWWNYTEERRDPALEWIAVLPEFQGLGLGKAIVSEAMRKMIVIEGDRDIYLHTQTWSYRAIGIYLQAGFEFVKEGAFCNYENDYEKALPYLKEKMGTKLL